MGDFPVHVRVFRFDPDAGGEQGFSDYRVNVSPGMSITNLFEYIQRYVDPGLAFTVSCRRGVCCTCLVRVNGKPVLACTQQIRPEQAELTVEPADRRKVIRDTVVNISGSRSGRAGGG